MKVMQCSESILGLPATLAHVQLCDASANRSASSSRERAIKISKHSGTLYIRSQQCLSCLYFSTYKHTFCLKMTVNTNLKTSREEAVPAHYSERYRLEIRYTENGTQKEKYCGANMNLCYFKRASFKKSLIGKQLPLNIQRYCLFQHLAQLNQHLVSLQRVTFT